MSEETAAIEDVVELRSGISRVFEEIVEQRRTVSGVSISPETSLQCSAVLACVRVLSEAVSQLPIHLMRRRPDGGKEIADDHPLYEVLAYQPNGWMTSFEFRELMQSWMLLWGNAYALIKSGRRGAVTELIPLHPSRMKVEYLENGRLRYLYQEPGKAVPVTYTQDQIFSLRWLSQDGITGYVPTSLSRDAIGLARATELHAGAYFGNGARPSTIIEVDQPMKPDTLQRLRESFTEIHAGAHNYAKTAVMPFGTHLKEFGGVNNDTAQLLQTRKHQIEEIARCYRVPNSFLNNLENVRFSTVEQSAIDFVTFSLIPHLRRWEMACRRDLISDDRTYFVEFDVTALMAGDYEARSQFLREMFNMGAVSVDEIRQSIGYNKLPNREGDKRFVQVNMQLLDAFTPESPTGKAQPQASAGSQATEESPSEEQPAQDGSQPEPAAAGPGAEEGRAAEALWQTTLRRLAATEADGILDRRNKPAKLEAWLQQHEARMRGELEAAGQATGRDTEQFVADWMDRTRELLLECHRSGKPYEEVTGTWTSRTK
jgi:HK97 family phage portal protein